MQTKDALALWKECHGTLKREDFIGDLSNNCATHFTRSATTCTHLHQHGFHAGAAHILFFRKCAVAWTKWPRAHPSSSRPPACTYARTCDPHTLTSVCHINLVFCHVLEIELVFLSLKLSRRFWLVSGLLRRSGWSQV